MSDSLEDLMDKLNEKPVNLNADENLTDAQIREKNKKFVEEVLNQAGTVPIAPPAPPTLTEMAILEQKANERGTIKDDSKNYSPTLPTRKVDDPLREKVVDISKLNFNKGYDPKDFFIRQTLDEEAIKAVQQKIVDLYDSPHTVINGQKVYKTYYFNVEAWCIELFFEAVGWDAKMVEAVMHESNNTLRSDIARIGFTQLAIAARGKK